MKNLLAFLFVFSTLFTTVNAQDMTLDKLLDNYFEAIGGKDKVAAMKTSKMKGNMNMGGMDFPGIIYSSAPDKIRVEVNVQGKEVVQAYDGETAWWINPFMSGEDPQIMPDDLAEDIKNEEFEDAFLNYKEKGHTAELLGKIAVEGTDTYEVKLTKKNGDIEFHYFEAEYFVPIMVKTMVKTGPSKGQFAESYMSDYEEVDGMMIPMFLETKVGGQSIQKITLTEIEINPELDEGMFGFPGKE